MIYFVACPEADAVKIGLTFNPPFHRLMSMQAGCPLELELVGLSEGGYAKERELHARFASARIRGEWFRLTDELRNHIALHPAPERPRRDTWRRLAAA